MFIQRKNLTIAKIEGDLGIFDEHSGKYFMLNEIGAVIWTKLEDPTTIEAIVGHLISIYDVSKEMCFEQVSMYIKMLQTKKLIEEV